MATLRLILWFYLPFEHIVLSPDPGHRRPQVSFELNPVFWGWLCNVTDFNYNKDKEILKQQRIVTEQNMTAFI